MTSSVAVQPGQTINDRRMADAVDRLYRDTVSLAPMVRASLLPLRALSLSYGADTVFTEETIDQKIISCDRRINDLVGTVDYVTPDGRTVLFRTCDVEKGRLVFQLGTANATLALEAAEKVLADVDAIDVNMGCPKKFSVHAGMGAALLSNPERAEDIIKTLKRNINKPISAKIRLLPTATDGVEFARRLQHCGVDALTIHARTLAHSSTDPAEWQGVRTIVQALDVPTAVNGDVYSREDIERCKQESGCTSVMIARGVLANPSIFRPEGMLPLYDVAREYLLKCVEYDLIIQGTKYTLMEMMCPRRHSFHKVPRKSNIHFTEFGGPTFEQVTRSRTVADLCTMFHVVDQHQAIQRQFHIRRETSTTMTPPTARAAAEIPAHNYDESYFFREECKAGEDDPILLPKRARCDSGSTRAEATMHGSNDAGAITLERSR